MSKSQKSVRTFMKMSSTLLGKIIISAFLVIALDTSLKAQTTLVTGDIAFSGYIANDTGPDRFSFVLLKAISTTTVIRFTDFGWRTDTTSFNSGAALESEIVFTAGGNFPAGTEIVITGTSASLGGGGIAGTIVYTAGATFLSPLSLASTGDQLFAYQGTFAAPTFITGIHMNVFTIAIDAAPNNTDAASWDGVILAPTGFINGNSSSKPNAVGNDLTTGTNAIWIGTTLVNSSERDNGKFTCGPDVSTAALARAALNNQANWLTNNTSPAGFGLPSGCGFLGVPTAADGSVSGRITDDIGRPVAGVTIRISGTQARRTITDGNGQYRFENVETGGFYTITPARANYNFSPAQRSFSLLGNHTDAAFTASPTSGGLNPLDTPEYFVRQHYLDFLGREPDEAGFNFWSDQILDCGADAGCTERRTINVSAAYFQSIEFQQTGGLVDGLYRASYGRAPRYAEFMPDTQSVARGVIVGRSDWAQQLEANKQAFVAAWLQRADFRAAYDGLTNSAFVDTLISHTAGGFNGNRDALVNGLNDSSLTRAAVLRRVGENEGFVRAKANEMFVMMEYFGYLRRDPDASGFAFWLNKLNQFNGNFEQAEMVKAFIVSGEYRDRFPR